MKAVRGFISHLAKGETDRHVNFQWYEVLNLAKEGKLSDESLRSLARNYGSNHFISDDGGGFHLENAMVLTGEDVRSASTACVSDLDLVAIMLAEFTFEDETNACMDFEEGIVRWKVKPGQIKSFREARNLVSVLTRDRPS